MKRFIPGFAALLLVAAAQGVHAHTELSSSTPADKAVLDTAPEEIVLTFSEGVRLTALSIQKAGAERQTLGPLAAGTSTRFAVAAPALSAGDYVIAWRAMSADTHVISGEISFTVEDAAHAEHGSPGHASH